MRLGSYVWWCRYNGVNEYGSPSYLAPIKIKTSFNYFTCQPITEYNDIKVFGEDSSSTWKVMIPVGIYESKFPIGEKDLFYVDGAMPNTKSKDYVSGDGANAFVSRPPTVVNKFTRVFLSARTEEK